MRTVHSVLLRSPPHLLNEVLMVDDASEKGTFTIAIDAYALASVRGIDV